MTKPGADGSRKSSRRNNARDKITSTARNPLQEVFEQHGGYACHHDLGERGGTLHLVPGFTELLLILLGH